MTNPLSAPSVSVVVPAYNEAERIGATLDRLFEWCAEHKREAEIIVVDDGSADATQERVAAAQPRFPRLRLIRLPENRGKGAAVRAGVLAAQGERILVCDADLSTPIEEESRLASALDRGFDIAIGSRGLPESDIRIHQPRYRELMGRTFNRIVRIATGLSFRDTQCGFKLFTRDAARAVFDPATVQRFAFDVEVLLIARERGLEVCEVPVKWSHAEQSRVSAVSDSARMLRDVLQLRLARSRLNRMWSSARRG